MASDEITFTPDSEETGIQFRPDIGKEGGGTTVGQKVASGLGTAIRIVGGGLQAIPSVAELTPAAPAAAAVGAGIVGGTDILAQAVERLGGARKAFSLPEAGVAAAAGAIPLGGLARLGFVARTSIRAAQGAAISAGATEATSLLETKKFAPEKELAESAAIGAAFGGGAEALLHGLGPTVFGKRGAKIEAEKAAEEEVRPSATKEGKVEKGVPTERPRDDTRGAPAEASGRGGVRAAEEVAPEEVKLPESKVADLETMEVPLDQITLSKDVPQFKKGADERGVVEPLAGKYERTGVAPVQLWRRTNGQLELISGRHRLDLAQRTGEKTIPAQIHDEKSGFTARHAARLDAELNIRDNQGTTGDYANYFRNSEITPEDAQSRGLLARRKGQAGFTIARSGSENLFALHQAGKLTDAQAEAIAAAAPNNEGAQQVGIKSALSGKSAEFASNLVKAAMLRTGGAEAPAGGDLFAFDDTAMREMEAHAQTASEMQRGIREQISAVQGAARKPEVAAKLGVDVKDPEGVQNRVKELRGELARWENWPMHPDLVKEVTGKELPPLKPKEEVKPSEQIEKETDDDKRQKGEGEKDVLEEPTPAAGEKPPPLPEQPEGLRGIKQAVTGKRAGIEPGEGATPTELLEYGRAELKAGHDPEPYFQAAEQGNPLRSDQMAIAGAKIEQLQQATDLARDNLRKDPNNPALQQAVNDAFAAEKRAEERLKPAQTDWGKQGQIQQFGTEVNAASPSGLRRMFQQINQRDVTEPEMAGIDKQAAKVQKAVDAEKGARKNFGDKVDQFTKTTKLKTKEELADHFAERLKALLPCKT